MAEDRRHDYVSTACHHGLHGKCRMTCKFCATPCGCRCHVEAHSTAGAAMPRQQEACACGHGPLMHLLGAWKEPDVEDLSCKHDGCLCGDYRPSPSDGTSLPSPPSATGS